MLLEDGVPESFVPAVRSLYNWCHTLVRSKPDLFSVRVGLRQRCPLSQNVFTGTQENRIPAVVQLHKVNMYALAQLKSSQRI